MQELISPGSNKEDGYNREGPVLTEEKVISCRVVNSIIKYLESAGCKADPVLKDLPYSERYLTDPFNWIPLSIQEILCQRAAKLLNDEQFMFKAALATPDLKAVGGLEHLVRLLGSPLLAYKGVPKYSRFFNKLTRFKIVRATENEVCLTMTLPPACAPSHHACCFARGILAAVPRLWGLPPAEVRETQCMCDTTLYRKSETRQYGAASCRYTVKWQPVKPVEAKGFKNILPREQVPETVAELEKAFVAVEEKNAELLQRNIELAKVREVALRIDSVRTVDEVYSLVVELARDIKGVRFVIVQKQDDSGEYLLTPYFSKIRSGKIKKLLDAIGFDLDKRLGKNATSHKLKIPISKIPIARDYRTRRRTMVVERLSDLLGDVLTKPLCDTIQKVTGMKSFVIVPFAARDEPPGTMVFFLDGDVSVDALEMVVSHCAMAINNVGILESREDAVSELTESQAMMNLIFESVAEGIALTDLEGTIKRVNWAVVRMHGFKNKDDVVGMNAFNLIAAKDRAKAKSDLGRTIEDGRSGTVEHTLLKKDGTEFLAEISSSLVKDGAGKPQGLVAVIRDVTESRKMQEQSIVRERLASIGELASGVAHEVNNPLTGVVGYSQLLLKRDVSGDIREYLEVINREALRAAKIVANLNNFAQNLKLEKRLVDINSAIGEVLAIRDYEHHVSNIKVETRFDPLLPKILADEFQIQQVFINIIMNAEYFMTVAHGRGTITITTEATGDMARISFADDGPGIAPEHLSHVFHPFFTTKEVGKGTGLGLSISYRIVADHGGKMFVESEPGNGATFVVELPISR